MVPYIQSGVAYTVRVPIYAVWRVSSARVCAVCVGGPAIPSRGVRSPQFRAIYVLEENWSSNFSVGRWWRPLNAES